MRKLVSLTILFFFYTSFDSGAKAFYSAPIKEKDSTFVADTSYHHSWKRASIWSACLPGAGQVYNEFGYRKVQNKKHRAWWKAPIIWGGLGVGGYYFYNYLVLSQDLKTEWLYRQDNGGMMQNDLYFSWSDDELISGKNNGLFIEPGFDLASRRRDVIGFGILAFWGLNVVEALVDAHFVEFDVSEDLTFDWHPVFYDPKTTGIALSLKF